MYKMNFDGASRGNPGKSCAGWIIRNKNGEPEHNGTKRIGKATNNEAEYKALICGLRCALKNNIDELSIRGDSQLVVHQVNGAWNVKSRNLIDLYEAARSLLEQLDDWGLEHVPRENNETADKLANKGFE